jgi:hypothetical protein
VLIPIKQEAEYDTDDEQHIGLDSRRRNLLLKWTQRMMIGYGVFLPSVQSAQARGLVQFPCPKGLANSYHFLRVGTSLFEQEGKTIVFMG